MCKTIGHAKSSLKCPLNPRNPIYSDETKKPLKLNPIKENTEPKL